MERFTGKIALVTGGSSGIGRAVALRLASEGASIGILARNVGRMERVVNEIRQMNRQAIMLLADVTNAQELRDAARVLVDSFNGRIDILVNCAGIYKRNSLENTTPETWDETMDTNLKGTFFASQIVSETMKQQGYRKIVNISSISGQIGTSSPDYAASKAAIFGLTRSLASILASHNINVNAVVPGPTDTDMLKVSPPDRLESLINQIPLKRLATPEDIASAVAFLCSDEASYITGSTIDVNGGLCMR